MDRSSTDSDRLIGLFARGDPEALIEVWSRYRRPMERLANRYLRRDPVLRNHYEGVDVMAETMVRIIELAALGQLESVDSLGKFWMMYRKVLAQILSSLRDAINAIKRGGPGKNGHSRKRPPCEGDGTDHPATFFLDDFEGFASDVRRPDVMVVVVELVERLLDLLDNPQLQVIAGMRLDGYTEPEIAEAMNLSLRTVQRRLAKIRKLWIKSGLLRN